MIDDKNEWIRCKNGHSLILYVKVDFVNECPLCFLIRGIKMIQAKIKNMQYNEMEKQSDE